MFGKDSREDICEFERKGLTDLEGGDVVIGRHLLVYGVDNFFSCVSERATEQPGRSVEDGLSFVVVVPNAFTFYDELGIFFEGFVCGERHPEVVEVIGRREVCLSFCVEHEMFPF